ncbi:MAG: YceI family protein [Bacteroidota bacterium]|nr:YceI family protein [Bacteroidota bacterium]
METSEIITQTKWEIDLSHSEIGFKVKHLMIANIKGVFKEFGANIYTHEADFMTSEIDFWINPASIDTGDKNRDEHLKGSEFFDVEKYKQISFIGNSYPNAANDGYELYGELTIKNITKQIKLNIVYGGLMKDPDGIEKAGFSVTGLINRKDWGLNWNTILETGGLLLSDGVRIDCEVELTKEENTF